MPNTQLLDQALAGRSEQEKARVLALILKMGVSPEDEFWLIFIALGQVQILLEDIPPQLDTFSDSLDQWTETNLKTLAALAGEAKQMTELVILLSELTTTFKALSNVWLKLTPDSLLSETTFSSSVNTLHLSNKVLTESLDLTRRTLTQQLTEISNSVPPVDSSPSGSKGRAWPVWVMVCMAAVIAISSYTSQLATQAQLRQANQNIEWLIQKQHQWDCAAGYLSPDNKVCQEVGK